MKIKHALMTLLVIQGSITTHDIQVTQPYTPSLWARYVFAYSCTSLGFLSWMSKGTKLPLLDKLLTNPAVVREELSSLDCPFFLLWECQQPHCLLNRLYDPQFRRTFESQAISALQALAKTHTRPIQYVSFACGGLFQDCVLLTKLLSKTPTASLDIHFIDPALHQNQEKPCAGDDRMRQLLSWLSKTFPQAQITVSAHGTVESYYAYIQTHQMEYPDIILAIDIEDRSAQQDYAKLCLQALQAKTDSHNILLHKSRDGTAGIVTISWHPRIKEFIDQKRYTPDETAHVILTAAIDALTTIQNKLSIAEFVITFQHIPTTFLTQVNQYMQSHYC